MDRNRTALIADYTRVRALSLRLCEPLRAEDYRVQSMPDVSPPWWNLGHTTWFFARNVLAEHGLDVDARFAGFDYALNSYYEGLGPRLPRPLRGKVSRPTTAAVLDYRAAIDAQLRHLLSDAPASAWPRLRELVTIGLHHEQQHQELFLSEILHIRYGNPPGLQDAYQETAPPPPAAGVPLTFLPIQGGVVEIGAGGDEFAWDNELPRHRAWLDDFAIANRLTTSGEWLQFMTAGGYRQPLLWLSNGWAKAQEQQWTAPLYWHRRGDRWWHWTLLGWLPVDPDAPVCHVSFYEAEAFARWCGARLPTEREWEHAAARLGFDRGRGNLLEDGDGVGAGELRPLPARVDVPQFAGDVWQWTTSHYEPYPGYRPFEGALMEYNGKFMDNQRVLRGGSLATPRSHIRASYRNFWPADTRFQFTGLRLAR